MACGRSPLRAAARRSGRRSEARPRHRRHHATIRPRPSKWAANTRWPSQTGLTKPTEQPPPPSPASGRPAFGVDLPAKPGAYTPPSPHVWLHKDRSRSSGSWCRARRWRRCRSRGRGGAAVAPARRRPRTRAGNGDRCPGQCRRHRSGHRECRGNQGQCRGISTHRHRPHRSPRAVVGHGRVRTARSPAGLRRAGQASRGDAGDEFDAVYGDELRFEV